MTWLQAPIGYKRRIVDISKYVHFSSWKNGFINNLVATLASADMATETANISGWKIFVDLFEQSVIDKNWPFSAKLDFQFQAVVIFHKIVERKRILKLFSHGF